MNELLVEWTLLREQEYLKQCLGLDIKRKILEQYSTEYGRIDFAHELYDGQIVITELETIVDNKAKMQYCQNQTLEYSNITFENKIKPIIAILIAQESPIKYQQHMRDFSNDNQFLYKTYSLDIVKNTYKRLISEAIANSGIPLVKPVANNFTHLACLNRFILPFYELEKAELEREDFVSYFDLSTDKADSHFKVHKQMCEYFELIDDISPTNTFTKVRLTDLGKRFCANLNYEFAIKKKNTIKRIALSKEQQRIIIESLMNGNIGSLKGKVNLLYFLRFIHLTEGVWIPRGRHLDEQKMEFANSFLGTNYSKITLSNWLNFTCTHCEELGLVERIKTTTEYDRANLTTLGSRVLGFIEMDLHLKRERTQIPLQI